MPPGSSLRGKEWRLLVETCQVVAAASAGCAKSSKEKEVQAGGIVALEFELREVRTGGRSGRGVGREGGREGEKATT